MQGKDKPIFPAQPDHGHYSRDRLVAEWLFNENGGDKVADSSLNKNHGTLVGPTWEDGRYGPVLNISAEAQDITTPKTASIDFQLLSEYTVIFNVILKTFEPVNGRSALLEARGGSTEGVLMHLENSLVSKGVRLIHNITGLNSDANVVTDLNRIYTIAFTYDGTDGTIYVDGQQVGSGALPQPAVCNAIYKWGGIASFGTSAEKWLGDFSYINIFSYALTAAQILEASNNPWDAWPKGLSIAMMAAAQAAPAAGNPWNYYAQMSA